MFERILLILHSYHSNALVNTTARVVQFLKLTSLFKIGDIFLIETISTAGRKGNNFFQLLIENQKLRVDMVNFSM